MITALKRELFSEFSEIFGAKFFKFHKKFGPFFDVKKNFFDVKKWVKFLKNFVKISPPKFPKSGAIRAWGKFENLKFWAHFYQDFN